MKKHSIISITITCFILGFTQLGAASSKSLYQWTDKTGKTHFSDLPPTDVDATHIKVVGKVKGHKPSTSISPPPTPPEEVTENKPQQPSELEMIPPAKDPKLCAQAKGNLKALSGTPRVRIKEPNGSQRILSEYEKQAQRDKARKHIRTYCN